MSAKGEGPPHRHSGAGGCCGARDERDERRSRSLHRMTGAALMDKYGATDCHEWPRPSDLETREQLLKVAGKSSWFSENWLFILVVACIVLLIFILLVLMCVKQP